MLISKNEIRTFQEAAVGELKSFVPELLEKKGWDTKTFVAYCMLAGMGANTAYRLARGETNVSVDTLSIAAQVLGVDTISEVIDLDPEQ
jgi:transcriptional regulator with XRE-family HTH domain